MSADAKRGWKRVKASCLISGVALFICPGALAATRSTSAYVVDNGENTIVQYTVLSNGTLVPDAPSSVATGQSPTSLVLSPDGKSAYVANSLSSTTSPAYHGTISQYNVAADGTLTPKSPATVQLPFVGDATGFLPEVVAVNPDGKTVYVATDDASTTNGFTDHIYEFSVGAGGTLSSTTPTVVDVGPGQPNGTGQLEGLVVSPDGKSVYFLGGGTSIGGSGNVYGFSVAPSGALTPKSPSMIGTGPVPVGIAVNPNGKTVYVVNSDAGSYDGGTGSISQYAVAADGTLTPDVPATVATGTNIYDPNSFPDDIAMSPTGTSALILTEGAPPEGRLRYTIAANGTLSPHPASLTAPTFPLDAGTPIAGAYNADSSHAYITDLGGGFVAGSGYNIGSDGPPAVEEYKEFAGPSPTQNTPSEALTHVPFEGSPFPFQIVLNNQPAFQGTAF